MNCIMVGKKALEGPRGRVSLDGLKKERVPPTLHVAGMESVCAATRRKGWSYTHAWDENVIDRLRSPERFLCSFRQPGLVRPAAFLQH